MLTPADIKRPAVRRVAHTVTALTSPIWALIALIAYSVGLINVVTLWSFEATLHWLNRLKWWAAEAFVKRRPTPLQPGDPLYAFSQSREMPDTACKVVKFRRYSEPFAERPGDIDTRAVPLPGSAEFWAALERRDHLDLEKHPL